MSDKEKVLQIINDIPESKMIFVVNVLNSIKGLLVDEVEPDEWDLEMIAQAEKENNGQGVPIETLAAELGIEL